MYLRYGVTTIRDTGNAGWMFPMRRRLLNGDVAGPRAFTSGPILDGDPPVWPFSIIVHNQAEADRAVDGLADRGADFVKVYERLTPEALHEIEAEARRRNLPVVGHVPELVRFEDAHIDDVQHLTGTINRPPRLYTLHEMVLVETKAWHDLDDARIAFVIKTSLDQHITHTPTIIVLDRSSRGEAYDAQFNEPTAQLLPRWYVEFWRRPDLGFTQQEVESLRGWGRFLPNMKLMVRRMHEAGVPLWQFWMRPSRVRRLHEQRLLEAEMRRLKGEFLLLSDNAGTRVRPSNGREVRGRTPTSEGRNSLKGLQTDGLVGGAK